MPNSVVGAVTGFVKDLQDKYNAGKREDSGLAAELKARADMTKAAADSLKESVPSVTPEPKPAPKTKPLQGPYGSRPGEKRYPRNMFPPLGSFHTGGKVRKTGVYNLEKGEVVIPKEKTGDNTMATPYDLITGGKKPKKEIKEMVHSKSHNGKHIVTHRHHFPEHHPDETHVFEDMKGVHDHMDQHDAGAEGAAPLTAAPSPDVAAAPAAGMSAGAPTAAPAGM